MEQRSGKASESFAKFMLWTSMSSICFVVILYTIFWISPKDDFSGGIYSFSGLIAFTAYLIVPVFVFIFLLNFIMMLIHDHLRKSLLFKAIYYLFLSGLLGLLMYSLLKPDVSIYYVCSLFPPFLFGVILEKGLLKKR
ncbi:hypothetical protein M3231_01805 [Neobacillus mesonae]|nr:hypothetical protein [Neobacillus mesonae]